MIRFAGCTLQTAAVDIAMLIVGRFVAGFSVGILSMIVPMYQVSRPKPPLHTTSIGLRSVLYTNVDPLAQAEISPPHARGLLSGMTQWMISWGFFVANWVGYGCGFLKTTAQFRVPLAIQIVPAVALLL